MRPTVRRALAVLPVALALAACGSGLEPQTYAPRFLGDATNVDIGALAVRNVTIEPPTSSGNEPYEEGESARVSFAIVNEGPEADQLVSASTPAAAEVLFLEAGVVVEQVEVEGDSGVVTTYGLLLEDLTEELFPGTVIELTLRFAVNGEQTFVVPVSLSGFAGEEAEEQRRERVETDSTGQVIEEEGEEAGGEAESSEEGESSEEVEEPVEGTGPQVGGAPVEPEGEAAEPVEGTGPQVGGAPAPPEGE